MDLEKLKNEIKKEEGYRDVLYSDHLGFATIGYGHLVKPKEKFIKDKKYDRKFLEKIFIYDVNIATRDAKSLCKKIEFDKLKNATCSDSPLEKRIIMKLVIKWKIVYGQGNTHREGQGN